MKTKLFLLLQTEQYDAALGMLQSFEDQAVQREFEKAYALYRLHRESEAAELLSHLKSAHGDYDRGVMHLNAQLVCCIRLLQVIDLICLKAYRQCAYQDAFDHYTQLLDSSSTVCVTRSIRP